MILAASMGEPPPTAMITSASKLRSCSSPFWASWMVGSGATSLKTWVAMPMSVSFCSMGPRMPLL